MPFVAKNLTLKAVLDMARTHFVETGNKQLLDLIDSKAKHTPKDWSRYTATAKQCLNRHDDYTGRNHVGADNLTRSNCGACVLQGYKDPTDDDLPGDGSPNYSGLARIFVESGTVGWNEQKLTWIFNELINNDNFAYVGALIKSINTSLTKRF